MSDTRKTGLFVIVAVALSGLAVVSSPGSLETLDNARFVDQGEEFYADFEDPLAVASLEVIAFDGDSGTATPFKVQVKNGLWTIPSHYDYPADGKDRLAKTAASIIDLRKDILASDRVEDHETLGVIDPLDETSLSLKGRGQRITLRGDGDRRLAEFIVGNKVEDKDGFHYMRVPDKKWTYAVKADIDISTKFADWIETNLLDLVSTDIQRIEVRDYSIDEGSGSVDVKGTVTLNKADGQWTIADLAETGEVDQSVARQIPTALSGIRITGVRPKPELLTRDLQLGEGLQLDLGTRLSLNTKGFFFDTGGQLLSNEGEVGVGTTDGIRYTLRFGEIVFGEGMEISAGVGEDADAAAADADGSETDAESGDADSGPENRYLFVTAGFDAALLGASPEAPADYVPTSELDAAADGQPDGEQPAPSDPPDADDPDTAGDEAAEQNEEEAARKQAAEDARKAAEDYERQLKDWETRVADGQDKARKLNDRFAAWYYVISGSDFTQIKVGRDKLVKAKESEETGG